MTSNEDMKRLRSTSLVLGLFLSVASTLMIFGIGFSMYAYDNQSQLLVDLGHIGFGVALEILGLGLIVLGKR